MEDERIDLTKTLKALSHAALEPLQTVDLTHACCLIQRWKTANGLSTALHTCAGSPAVCLLLHKRGKYLECTVTRIGAHGSCTDRRCQTPLFKRYYAAALYERASPLAHHAYNSMHKYARARRAHTHAPTHTSGEQTAPRPPCRAQKVQHPCRGEALLLLHFRVSSGINVQKS